LDTTYPTLGKLLNNAGYATAHFGKWHLGAEPYSPLQHGFDVDIPHHPGPGPAGSYVAPWNFQGFKENSPKEHIEDRMASEAVNWMKSIKGDKPFFLNYWQFSVHGPWGGKQRLIDHYRDKIDPSNAQRSPTYAAMVHSLDDAVGTLLDAVDKAGITDSTAIIFISDNGGNIHREVDGTRVTSNKPLRGGKATMFEGGIRVPCIVVWPGLTKPGTRSDELIQTSDFYPTILKQMGIKRPPNHRVDGADITPILRGGKLEQRPMFTYFPHQPKVHDWLPPSVSVHYGDWKLIRIFHYGENGAHDYRLFNLATDLGEESNLAAGNPNKVSELDKLIEDYLKDSNAVVPLPNPNFDPAQYHPEKIGEQAVKQ
jgi:arylsulfatase A-like enzyme